jgi:hypothetical protein
MAPPSLELDNELKNALDIWRQLVVVGVVRAAIRPTKSVQAAEANWTKRETRSSRNLICDRNCNALRIFSEI